MVAYLLTTVILFRDFIFSGDMLLGQDTLALGYTARLFFAEALQSTGFPSWNPHILGGTPFLESLAGGDSLHPLSVALFWLTEVHRALGWKLVIHVFLSGIFMWGWLRMLGLSRGASLVGGLGFLLSPWFVTLVFPGHDGKMFVTAMAPLLFWLSEWMWRRRDLVPAALLALSIALVILSTHFQMAYFLFGAVGLYMIFRTVGEARTRGWSASLARFGTFLAFSVLGAGVSAIQLLPAYSYVTEDSRRAATTIQADPAEARAYSTSWSLHPEEMASLVVPEFIGGDARGSAWTTDTYWGRNPFKLNHEYLGALVLLLALLAFLPFPRGTGRSPEEEGGERASRAPPEAGPGPAGLRWFLLALGGTGLLFSLGDHTPVWRIMYEVIPGISLFRAPSMAIFIPGLAALGLAAMGIDRAARMAATPEGLRRVVTVPLVATGLFVLGAIMATTGGLFGVWTSIFDPGLDQDSWEALQRVRPHVVTGFMVLVVLSALVAGLWWAAGSGRLGGGVRGGIVLATGLALLVGADLFRVNTPFLDTIDPARVTVPDPNLRFLVEEQRAAAEPIRVFSMRRGGEDVEPATFGLDLAGGHHPNDLLRYREFIGMAGGGFPEHLVGFHPVIMDLLAIRYILWPDEEYGALEGVEAARRGRGSDGRVQAVYPYPGGPRARVVGQAIQVEPGEAMAVLLEDEAFDPRTQLVLEEAPPHEGGGPGVEGTVRWVERTPDRLVLEVESTGPGYLLLSENYFPAWQASVDGEEAPVLRANHVQRAVPISGGRQQVEMWYDSPELARSLRISVFSLLLVTGAGLASGLGLLRRRSEPGDAPESPDAPDPDPDRTGPDPDVCGGTDTHGSDGPTPGAGKG
ncbi:MAG: hypothetical protein EA352_12210 [Gemmatimonadales bacterium]|nr:MAG: hypothetical protein EA352_12210 [Gemmatimonadales bacterium]